MTVCADVSGAVMFCPESPEITCQSNSMAAAVMSFSSGRVLSGLSKSQGSGSWAVLMGKSSGCLFCEHCVGSVRGR